MGGSSGGRRRSKSGKAGGRGGGRCGQLRQRHLVLALSLCVRTFCGTVMSCGESSCRGLPIVLALVLPQRRQLGDGLPLAPRASDARAGRCAAMTTFSLFHPSNVFGALLSKRCTRPGWWCIALPTARVIEHGVAGQVIDRGRNDWLSTTVTPSKASVAPEREVDGARGKRSQKRGGLRNCLLIHLRHHASQTAATLRAPAPSVPKPLYQNHDVMRAARRTAARWHHGLGGARPAGRCLRCRDRRQCRPP